MQCTDGLERHQHQERVLSNTVGNREGTTDFISREGACPSEFVLSRCGACSRVCQRMCQDGESGDDMFVFVNRNSRRE